MIFELLKRCIEQKNEFLTIDMVKLQIEYFALNKKLTQAQKEELIALIPVEVEVPIEVEVSIEGDSIDNSL